MGDPEHSINSRANITEIKNLAAPLPPLQPVITSGIRVPILDGTNFKNWKMMIDGSLELRGLHGIVTGEIEVTRANRGAELQAKMAILETLNDAHLTMVNNCETSKEIMDRLCLTYADKSAANIGRMLKKYYGYKLQPGDSMSAHLSKMELMRKELESVDQPQTDEVFINQVLSTLPSEYGMLKEIWDNNHPDQKTIANLFSRILKKEEDLSEQKQSSDSNRALLVSKSGNYKKKSYEKNYNERNPNERNQNEQMTIEERKKITRCAKCGSKGHWARECKTKPENYRSKTDSNRDNQAQDLIKAQSGPKKVVFSIGELDEKMRNYWFADSGATPHICNNRDWFEDLIEYSQPKTCSVGNGEKVKVIGHGNVTLINRVGERT